MSRENYKTVGEKFKILIRFKGEFYFWNFSSYLNIKNFLIYFMLNFSRLDNINLFPFDKPKKN